MKFSELQKNGATISDKPSKHTVEWENHDGETFKWDTYIRPLNCEQWAAYIKADETGDKLSSLMMVSESLFEDEQGTKRVMTYEQANTLDPTFLAVLRDKVIQANTKKKKPGKKTKNSGTSLSSPELVEEPSPKPSETSA